MLLLLLLTFVLPIFSTSFKDESFPVLVDDPDDYEDGELVLKPLCVVDIEMRDGCDGEQKCRCPKGSACRVTSVEDRLSVCKSAEIEPTCHYGDVNTELIFLVCNRYCFCPNGYTCHEGYGPLKPMCSLDDSAVTEQPQTTPAQEICPSGSSCNHCVCPDGQYCHHTFKMMSSCRDIEPKTEAPQTTELAQVFPICDYDNIGHPACEHHCHCPKGYACIGGFGPWTQVFCASEQTPTEESIEPSTPLQGPLPICAGLLGTSLFDRFRGDAEPSVSQTKCDLDCQCEEGKECKVLFGGIIRFCLSTGQSTALEPLTTESPLPFCHALPVIASPVCDKNCVCEAGTKCAYRPGPICEPVPDCSHSQKYTVGCEGCTCPSGYECKVSDFMIHGHFPLFCVKVEDETTSMEPTHRPLCQVDVPENIKLYIGCGQLCDCPDGYYCASGFRCIKREPTPLPVCVPFEEPFKECDKECVCPEGVGCITPLSYPSTSSCNFHDGEKQSVIEKVDELADEAIDLAKQQLDKVQQIHETIEEEENVDGAHFKGFA